MRDAISYVQSGKLGKVDLAIGLCYKPRGSIGKVTEPTAPPASMDYDLWCGPAPATAAMRKKIHYDWHWQWAYGNGDLGNQGVHEMDKARWGLGKSDFPEAVVCAGGRFGYVDDGETANTQLATFDYGDSKLIFEVRGLETKDYKGAKVGNIWVGTEGYVVCPSYSGGVAYDKDGKKLAEFKGGSDQHHFDNFVKAVRSRDANDLNADIAEGQRSAALCHLANVSYRCGVESPIAKDSGMTDHKPTNEFFVAMIEHLKANKVDVAAAKGRFGTIALDPSAGTIKHCTPGATLAQANAMLFREYRKGFEVKQVS
jgi:hypothetical protein